MRAGPTSPRRRRPGPEGGLRLRAPRREGGPPLRRGHCGRPEAGAWPRPDCPRTPSSWWRTPPGPVRQRADDRPGLRGPAHPPGGRGADPGLCGQRHRPRASRRAPASATSMWTGRPTWTWRWTSWRTPSAAGPACATPPRCAWSTGTSAPEFLPRLRERLTDDRAARASPRWSCAWTRRPPRSSPARPRGREDFDTEFLDYILAVQVVDGVEEAIDHIAAHSTGHRDGHRHRGRGGRPALPDGGWTPPPCTGTPPPALPTGGSSAWAARWASPPRSSTPGAPWGWRSCAPSSSSSGAGDRSAEAPPLFSR